jgi:hypothetical protein
MDADKIDKNKFKVESIPEPFIGNPDSATVVLLSGNPYDSVEDPATHKIPAFRNAMRSNLCRQPGSDFYPLNPDFRQTPCGVWWRKCLKELLAELSAETLAKKMLVVEWFPYHSKNGKALPKKPVPSQLYSFQLAKEMLDREKANCRNAR